MNSNKASGNKWISEETSEEEELFNHCREMSLICYAITKVVLDADNKWKSPSGNNKHSLSNRSYIMGLVNLQVLDQLIEYLSKLVKSFYKLNPKLARLKKDNGLILSKHDHIFDNLCGSRFVMMQAMYNLITTILETCLHREDCRKMIESCLSLVETYNQLVGLSYKKFMAKFNVCSNTYPNTISETKPITLTKIVQVLAKSRVENNCHRLINCLVRVYKPEEHSDDSSSSTAESLEIYHTLTKHITPPTSCASRSITVEKRREAFVEHKKNKMKQAQSLVEMKNLQNKKLNEALNAQYSDCEIPYTSLLTNECALENIFSKEESVNTILQSEEIYIEILLDTVANKSPTLLGTNGVRKFKSGRIQASKKAAHKVTEYYQNVLWGDVGSCLEHIVLWWSALPLAVRSPNTSQNLREWLFATFNTNNTPELILAALRILADALGCHVTTTSWDKHFGATLTTNLNPISLKSHPDLSLYVTECSVSGANFALMLQELVTLNNQCEVTWDYIMGAPLEDLPIVEQIPILHRLDHSIHTYRLWCVAESRRLADAWRVDQLFRVTHHDMPAAKEQLHGLRFADHSPVLESGKIGVHENVCAKMREKLVSEVKVNIQKFKEASDEITCMLSCVCATLSLAHLTMIFPSSAHWKRLLRPHPNHSAYVRDYLDKMLLPVIKATTDIAMLNMVLRIMCESWLHHIYVVKVKFSKEAALQLLADFNEVRNWLNECNSLATAARKQMLHNEVLRRCEGVGRLLLHAPGDLISMQESTMHSMQQPRPNGDSEGGDQLMPAEMYVPNQKQWLTLRAGKLKGPLAFTLCCIVLV